MAGDPEPLDYAGRTPVQPAANHGEGGENRALAEGCLAVVLLAGIVMFGGIFVVAFGYWCL